MGNEWSLVGSVRKATASYNRWYLGYCLAQLLARMVSLNFMRNASLVGAGSIWEQAEGAYVQPSGNILETHHLKSLYQGSQTVSPRAVFGSKICLAQCLLTVSLYFLKLIANI